MTEPTRARPGSLPPAYKRILIVLERQSGLCREEIAEKAYVATTTLSGGGYMRHMKELGLIHISGWRRNASGAFVIPLYSAGRSQDYARPKMSDENRAAPGMLRLLEVIERHGPLDYRQAARLAGLAANTAKNAGYLKALVAQGRIHISDWRRSRNGPPRPIYDSGKGVSANPPIRLPSSEKSRAHRIRRAARDGSFIGQIQQYKMVQP
ncbi:MAG: hypothetical protein WC100_16480 [Sterolibacterium sp.]